MKKVFFVPALITLMAIAGCAQTPPPAAEKAAPPAATQPATDVIDANAAHAESCSAHKSCDCAKKHCDCKKCDDCKKHSHKEGCSCHKK